MEYPFLGDPLLDPPSLGHPLLEGPSYFEASAFHGPALGGHFPEDISLEDCPLEDDSDDGCASEDSTSEDDSPGETSLDGSSLESSLLDDDSLETPSLYDASPHSQSPGSSSGEDLSQDEFRENLPVQGPSLVSASPVPSLSLAMSSPFCLAPVYGTTCTPVYFMLLPDGKTPSGISAEKAVTSPAPSCDPRPTPLPSQPAPSGNAWDTMRELVPLAGRRQSVRRRPSLRCGPPQRTYEGIARRASVAAPWKKQQVATRTVPEHWYGAGKKLSQPWKETVSLLRTPAKTGASARNSADVAATKGRWMRRRPTKADVPPMPKKMNRCGRCEVCSKTYKRLDKHMLVHLQLRPHECLVCGRRFTQSEHLKRHQQKHAETMDPLRQCKCTECGKVLSRRDKLKDHLSHAHGIKSKPAVCD
ncbi:zinc finger protein 358-like [Thrips palmi]|uniref:Zinc finger protein 358-like n=1 Tax=Thrips palmi TaxID=161013 RepID=A0A6P8ZSB7_THRPL|nr:zinc finger protein 358-like [Thrips palmi]